jgi:hypothetical protein
MAPLLAGGRGHANVLSDAGELAALEAEQQHIVRDAAVAGISPIEAHIQPGCIASAPAAEASTSR